MVDSEISGISQRRNGPIKRDVCSTDIRSVEPPVIKIIQRRTGSQYFKNLRIKNKTTCRLIVLISPACRKPASLNLLFSNRSSWRGSGVGGVWNRFTANVCPRRFESANRGKL